MSIDTLDESIYSGLEYAESMQELSNTVNGIWSAFSLKEKLHFLKKAGYDINIPENLKKIYE